MNKELQRHSLSAAYCDLTGQAWEDFKENAREYGVQTRSIMLLQGKVLDGWQLYRACCELDLEAIFAELPEGVDPERFVRTENDYRRHMTPNEQSERRKVRIERVAKLSQKGESPRKIAGKVGVSESQVRRDIEVAGAPPGAPGNPEIAKVLGADGKTYPAKKPRNLCDRCTRVGGGGVKGCPACRDLNHKPKGPPKPKPPEDPDAPPLDAFGNPIPRRCRDAYADPWIQEAIDFLGVASVQFWQARLADGMRKREKRYPFFDAQDFTDCYGSAGNNMDQILDHLKELRPAGVCPPCHGDGCGHCKMSGLVPRKLYEELKGAAK